MVAAGPEGTGTGWAASQAATALTSAASMRRAICAMQSGAWARRSPVCHAPSWALR